jgi:hypothetical protein
VALPGGARAGLLVAAVCKAPVPAKLALLLCLTRFILLPLAAAVQQTVGCVLAVNLRRLALCEIRASAANGKDAVLYHGAWPCCEIHVCVTPAQLVKVRALSDSVQKTYMPL